MWEGDINLNSGTRGVKGGAYKELLVSPFPEIPACFIRADALHTDFLLLSLGKKEEKRHLPALVFYLSGDNKMGKVFSFRGHLMIS